MIVINILLEIKIKVSNNLIILKPLALVRFFNFQMYDSDIKAGITKKDKT